MKLHVLTRSACAHEVRRTTNPATAFANHAPRLCRRERVAAAHHVTAPGDPHQLGAVLAGTRRLAPSDALLNRCLTACLFATRAVAAQGALPEAGRLGACTCPSLCRGVQSQSQATRGGLTRGLGQELIQKLLPGRVWGRPWLGERPQAQRPIGSCTRHRRQRPRCKPFALTATCAGPCPPRPSPPRAPPAAAAAGQT
jgi:hypothetical protein